MGKLLSPFPLSSRGYERFEQQDRSIEKFRRFATHKNIHVTLVIHPRKEADNEPLGMQSVFGGAKVPTHLVSCHPCREAILTPLCSLGDPGGG